jgi:hypothetical protein
MTLTLTLTLIVALIALCVWRFASGARITRRECADSWDVQR